MKKTITLDVKDWDVILNAVENDSYYKSARIAAAALGIALKSAPTVVQVETLAAIGDGVGTLQTGTISTATTSLGFY